MKYPLYVDFSITPLCNLSCKFCYVEANLLKIKKKQLLTLRDFDSIYTQFDEMGIMRVGFEGESLF